MGAELGGGGSPARCAMIENDITKVDISIDNGATWQPAKLVGEQARFTWRRFEFSFNAAKPESVLILSRATDSKGITISAKQELKFTADSFGITDYTTHRYLTIVNNSATDETRFLVELY